MSRETNGALQVGAVTLELPLPPAALSQNARSKWGRIKATTAYRNRAEMEARKIPAGQRPGWTNADASVVFYFPTKRRRDAPNFAAMLKPAWDGFVRAGILQDDEGLTVAPPEMRMDKARPRVEITITQRSSEPAAA